MTITIDTYLSIITLNISGLNVPVEKYGVADWIIRQESTKCCLQETHFSVKDIYRLKMRGQKKLFCANRNDQKGGIAILRENKLKTMVIEKEKDTI